MKGKKFLRLLLVFLSAGFVLASILLLFGCAPSKGAAADQAHTEASIRYVAPEGSDVGDCTDPTAPCASVQYAVDQANEGDEVRIAAGTYTHLSGRPAPPGYAGPSVITQCVYLTKTLTLRGGYTSQPAVDEGQGGWSVSDPAANPTILDAQERGRVLFIGGEISPTIEGMRITEGDASYLGGALGGELVYYAGGGIYVLTATATISHSEVISNYGGSSWGEIGGIGSSGGGIYLLHSPSKLINNTISDNHSVGGKPFFGGGGGGITIESSSAVLIGNTFQDNSSSDGGAIFIEGSPALLMDNQIRDNKAISNLGGGGIFLADSNATLLHNVLADNHVATYDEDGGGGGIRISGGSPQLIGNVISGNQFGIGVCKGSGGGVYIWESNATFINNVFTANCAYWGAHASIWWDSSPTFLHNTFTNAGAGLSVNGESDVTLTNSIFAGHGIGVTVELGSSVTIQGVLWYDNETNLAGEGAASVSAEYSGDPAFAADGYRLTAASAAIDRGVNAGVETDIDGLPRMVGPAPDLGAHEYPVALRPNLLYFPVAYKQELLHLLLSLTSQEQH